MSIEEAIELAFARATEGSEFVTAEDVANASSEALDASDVDLVLSIWSRSIDAPVNVKEKVDADSGRPIWRRD